MATLWGIRSKGCKVGAADVDEASEELPGDDFAARAAFGLPGWTVEALVREGKVEEAQVELQRLLQEGVDSGPGIPVTPEFWAGLRQELADEAKARR